LALAVLSREISAEQAYSLSRIDFDYQADQWGQDEEAQELAEAARVEVAALSKLL
jgi:chaperone required for assembly of F1-ATPase